MKLQDAYAAERNAAGGWKLIGYTLPASNNFAYTGTGIDDDATVELDNLEATLGWQAQNKVALNDCGAEDCLWQVKLDKGDKGGQIQYAACLSSDATPLTANYTAISTPGKSCSVE